MAEEDQDITPELIELGVGIAIGVAGLQASGEATEDMVNAIRNLWPEELSADALEVSSQVALAMVAWLNETDAISYAIEGHHLLAFSQSLLPTQE